MQPEPERIVTSLRAAARKLMEQRNLRDLEELLSSIVSAAAETVPGADAAGISMTRDGHVDSRAPSNLTITKLDELQSELHQGPCITALDDPPPDGLVLANDLTKHDGTRWPDFAPHAVDAGYRSMLSIQLSASPGMRAALNLYAVDIDVFDAEARLTAGLFGVQAAALLYGAEQALYLQRAVDSRDVIGQAKGILMERFTVDGNEAFQMLVTSSQETNIKLVEVAQWLVGEADQRRLLRGRPGDDKVS